MFLRITLLNGGVLSVCVVQIPQRFITVNGASPFAAAAKLLAFGAFVIFGTVTAVPAMDRFGVHPSLLMAAGGCLELIGTALLSQASSAYHIHASQYGCQVLVGTGVGLIVSAVMMLIRSTFDERDYGKTAIASTSIGWTNWFLAVATAAQSQFRTLGGLIGVSIGTTITNRSLEPQIRAILSPSAASLLLEKTERLALLSGPTLSLVRVAFGTSYSRQMYLAVGLAAVCLPTAMLAWKAPAATASRSPVEADRTIAEQTPSEKLDH
jgi:MFS family permease